jgi:hypothetical protein
MHALQDRAVQSSGEWRKAMQDVDRQIFDHMRQQIKGGFDEERFGSRIGFANLKRWERYWTGSMAAC